MNIIFCVSNLSAFRSWAPPTGVIRLDICFGSNFILWLWTSLTCSLIINCSGLRISGGGEFEIGDWRGAG